MKNNVSSSDFRRKLYREPAYRKAGKLFLFQKVLLDTKFLQNSTRSDTF